MRYKREILRIELNLKKIRTIIKVKVREQNFKISCFTLPYFNATTVLKQKLDL